MNAAAPNLSAQSAAGRWVIAAGVLGTSVAFLDSTVVNAALPSIAGDLHADLADLQWVKSGYLLTLGAFLVLGGALGDLFGRRRMFLLGLAGFALASVLCGAAPSVGFLIAARCVQGVTAALLMPESLAIISASFRAEDRGRAIGLWSAFGGIGSAVGPFLGGSLIDSVSWRLVFFINVPIIAVTIAITLRHVPETRDLHSDRRIDLVGGALLVLGLAGVVYGLIEGPAKDWAGSPVVLGIAGVGVLLAWLMFEHRSSRPMVPLRIFRSRQFSGANGATFLVYAGINAAFFLLVVYLQTDLGYSALEAGAVLLPVTGFLLLQLTNHGSSFFTGVLPGMLVIGLGIAINLAPLTTAVLAAIDDDHAGIASAINNAVARLAGLLAIAVVPAAAGLASSQLHLDLSHGFDRAMQIAAGLSAVGALVAWLTIRHATPVQPVTQGNVGVACQDPCVKEAVAA